MSIRSSRAVRNVSWLLGLSALMVACPRNNDVSPETSPAAVSMQDLLMEARRGTFEEHGGWMDEQKLWQFERREVNGQMADVLVPGPWASIMPVRGLGREEQERESFYEARWRPVARIVAHAPYDSLHIRTRGLSRAGEPLDTNFLVLRRIRDNAQWVWEAGMLSTADTLLLPLRIRQEVHTPVPPGVVRWIADPRDDSIWVRCAGGCCVVDGPRHIL